MFLVKNNWSHNFIQHAECSDSATQASSSYQNIIQLWITHR